MADTKIEWAEKSWNPITGCSKISAGCLNCYAERMSKRLAGRCGYPDDEPFAVTIHRDKIFEPRTWRKPQRVFVCSMGDLFHDDVPVDHIANIFMVMRECEQHTFLVLTKRPARMKKIIDRLKDWGMWPLLNVWLGVSAENQETADERIPILLQTPAAVRFVSCEPLLGPVDLRELPLPEDLQPAWAFSKDKNLRLNFNALCEDVHRLYQSDAHLDWVIAGGETGPGARPMHPDWVRGLRDQFQAVGTPFFFKSWGDWASPDQCEIWEHDKHSVPGLMPFGDYQEVHRVGKKAAGRRLDGQTWDQYPEAVTLND